MPDNFALYVLLVITLGVGFLFGRRERKARARDMGIVAEDYFKGLNHLLNERHDLAIDTFVESMAIDNDTVDTHLALGSLVRRRGEVEKAIRIHQNLLARPVLSAGHRAQTELELARDYLMAGLLDRAESLLLELVGKSGTEQRIARELLLEIYQREKDWAKAVEVGQALVRQDKSVRGKLAHFQCEIAEEHLRNDDLKEAQAALRKGAKLDGGCARLSLLEARVEFAAGNYAAVRRSLEKACELDPTLARETLTLYRSACEELGDVEAFVKYLRARQQVSPDQAVVTSLAEHIEGEHGMAAAQEFVHEIVERRPTLPGFVTWLEQIERQSEPVEREQLAMVLAFSRSLLSRQPNYRCRQCGFSSKTLMWQCPSCRTWGGLKPVAPEAGVG